MNDIEKVDLVGRDVIGELDGFMGRIKEVYEFFELFFSMGPNHGDVINVAPSCDRLEWKLGQYFLFKVIHKKSGAGKFQFCKHCSALELVAYNDCFQIQSYSG